MTVIRFGWMSMFLLVLAGQALVIAVALARTAENRRANLYLAALLVVLTGMMVPYIIGYAGFYDRYPWLSYAPFAVPLAVGPLAYGHVRALVTGAGLTPIHWLLPAAQFLNQALVFPWPLESKNWFDVTVQVPLLEPVIQPALILSLAGYSYGCLRLIASYRRRAGIGAKAVARLRRLRVPLALLLLLLVSRSLVAAWDAAVAPLDYIDRFGFYVLLAIATAWLGVEGWRHAREPFPLPAADRDWAAQGAAWRAQLAGAGWWRDPELTLDGLARRLGTNTTHLSRALNASGGSFADLLGALRAEEVARRLDGNDGGDLLGIALAAGFGSKASFNRAFRARYGMAPSEYRRDASKDVSGASRAV